jgi:hypothetical protein
VTSHDFQFWQDHNAEPLPYDMDQAERDTAVNTLREILALTGENLPDSEACFRVGAIARATLAALEELPTDLEPADAIGDDPDADPPF